MTHIKDNSPATETASGVKEKDSGILPELTPAPCDHGDDDDASSTATIVEEDAPSDAEDIAAPAEVIPKASEKETVSPRPEVATELGDQNDPVPVDDELLYGLERTENRHVLQALYGTGLSRCSQGSNRPKRHKSHRTIPNGPCMDGHLRQRSRQRKALPS